VQLARIPTPTLVCDGLHEEAIRGTHTRYLAKAIPGARLLLLAGASHFGMLQTPTKFNRAVVEFLDVP
jgi:pimeloyl-ACP methyl ester carboxylesterase